MGNDQPPIVHEGKGNLLNETTDRSKNKKANFSPSKPSSQEYWKRGGPITRKKKETLLCTPSGQAKDNQPMLETATINLPKNNENPTQIKKNGVGVPEIRKFALSLTGKKKRAGEGLG